MQDDYEKLEMIREKYDQNRDKGIPLIDLFTPEEHLYILKYIFEYVLREMGSTRTLTYDEILRILERMGEDQE